MNLPIESGSVRPEVRHQSAIVPEAPTVDGLNVLAIWQKVFDGVTSIVQDCTGSSLASHSMHSGLPLKGSPAAWTSVRAHDMLDGIEEKPADAMTASLVPDYGEDSASAHDGDMVMSLLATNAQVPNANRPLRADTFVQPSERSHRHDLGQAHSLNFLTSTSKHAQGDEPTAPVHRMQEMPDSVREPMTSSSEESVLVFRDEQGIEIVVRNTALAAASAVRCALETARQIAGHDRALKQVKLNGRTVYVSVDHLHSPATEERKGGVRLLVFAC